MAGNSCLMPSALRLELDTAITGPQVTRINETIKYSIRDYIKQDKNLSKLSLFSLSSKYHKCECFDIYLLLNHSVKTFNT